MIKSDLFGKSMQYARQKTKDKNEIIKEIQEALAQIKEKNDQTLVVSPESANQEQELAENWNSKLHIKQRVPYFIPTITGMIIEKKAQKVFLV